MDYKTAVKIWIEVIGSSHAGLMMIPGCGEMLEEFAGRVEAMERERCAKIVDVPGDIDFRDILGGQETVDVLRLLAAKIRQDDDSVQADD